MVLKYYIIFNSCIINLNGRSNNISVIPTVLNMTRGLLELYKIELEFKVERFINRIQHIYAWKTIMNSYAVILSDDIYQTQFIIII